MASQNTWGVKVARLKEATISGRTVAASGAAAATTSARRFESWSAGRAETTRRNVLTRGDARLRERADARTRVALRDAGSAASGVAIVR